MDSVGLLVFLMDKVGLLAYLAVILTMFSLALAYKKQMGRAYFYAFIVFVIFGVSIFIVTQQVCYQ